MVTYQEWIYLISDLPIPLVDGNGKRLSKELERMYFDMFKEFVREEKHLRR